MAEFERFAADCEAALARPDESSRRAALARVLSALDDDALRRGVTMLAGHALPDERRLGRGWLVEAGSVLGGWETEVVRTCVDACGDAGEALGLLVEGRPLAPGVPLTLEQADRAMRDVLRAKGRGRTVDLLVALLGRLAPVGVTWVVRLLAGTRPVDVGSSTLEEVVSIASGLPADEIRRAVARSGDLAEVALAARARRLGELGPTLFVPIEPMQAQRVGVLPAEDARGWVEPRWSGVRVQAHVEGGRVALFDVAGVDVAAQVPEVTRALRTLAGPLVLDGCLVLRRGDTFGAGDAVRDRLRPHTATGPQDGTMQLALFDLLVDGRGRCLDLPLDERRASLTERLRLANAPELLDSAVFRPPVTREATLEEAAARGWGGWISKRTESPYLPGATDHSWSEWVRPERTLLAVLSAVERSSEEAGALVTRCSVSVQGATGFVGLGRAVLGLDPQQLRALEPRVQALTLERYGRTLWLAPELVVEVAYEGVQRSSRAASGFQLRGARVFAVRDDVQPHAIAELRTIEAAYEEAVGERRESRGPPARTTGEVDDLPLFASRPPKPRPGG